MSDTTAPAVEGDFYDLAALLEEEDRLLLKRVRTFMEEHVAPIINVYWGKAEFPFEVLPAMAELGIAGRSFLADGFVALELARIDPSMATFMGVHGGLAMGSIYLCGSEEQKAQWLPAMARMEKIGAFGLTEPEVGSGAAGGLTTTARQNGDTWVLHGVKKWIGNATFADVVVIWARDVDDGNVKGFLVEKGTPGFSTEKMEHKIALRAVQNAVITLDGAPVPESMRLQRASSFRDTANVLRTSEAVRRPGGSLMVYAAAGAAGALHGLDDEEVRARFKADLCSLYPELGSVVSALVIQRWERGLPYAAVGRGRLQAALTRPLGRIHLAGDYLGTWYTETACQTAEAAARAVRSLAAT